MGHLTEEKGMSEVDQDLLCPICMQIGCEVPIKELDTLLALLIAEEKRKMEQEEVERNMQILLDFLNCLRKQKVQELNEVQSHLQFLKEDISVVERRRMDLYRAGDRYSVRQRMLGGDDSVNGARNSWPSSIDNNTSAQSMRRNVLLEYSGTRSAVLRILCN